MNKIKTHKWNPSDTIENFNLNPEKDKWIDVDINYSFIEADKKNFQFNEENFRMYNITERDKKIACFGCSNTLGIGLPEEWTWSYLLTQKLGFDEYSFKNYGINGASVETIARILYDKVINDNDNYEAIFILFPDYFRYEWKDDFGVFNRLLPFNFVRNSNNECEKKYTTYGIILNEYNSFFKYVKYCKFIEEICKNKNIPIYWYNWSYNVIKLEEDVKNIYLNTENTFTAEKAMELYELGLTSKARDGIHYGKIYNEKLADYFLELFKKP